MTDPRPPRWAIIVLLFTTGLVTVFASVTAVAFGSGPTLWAVGLTAVFSGLGWLFVMQVHVRPRRPRDLRVDDSGISSVEAPTTVVMLILGMWFCGLGATGGWVAALLTDRSEIESMTLMWAQFLLVAATLPDLARLLTGRLHRWRLILTPDVLLYQGYRTKRSIPWAKVSGIRVTHDKQAHVVVRTKGKREPDLHIPFYLFDIPAQQFIDEIEARIDSARKQPRR